MKTKLELVSLSLLLSLVFPASGVLGASYIDLGELGVIYGPPQNTKTNVSTTTNLTTSNRIEVVYKQSGKILAIFPITFEARVVAHVNGEIEIRYPWYSFLMIDNKTEVGDELQGEVNAFLQGRGGAGVNTETGTKLDNTKQ